MGGKWSEINFWESTQSQMLKHFYYLLRDQYSQKNILSLKS